MKNKKAIILFLALMAGFSLIHHSEKKHSQAGFLPTIFFGGSYFFNDAVGLNTEFGYNFAYVTIGLNFRISK